MATKYEVGATVYELAAEFGCHRATVAERLKKMGILMRGHSPSTEDIDSMVRLCATGLSFQDVGQQLGIVCVNDDSKLASAPSRSTAPRAVKAMKRSTDN